MRKTEAMKKQEAKRITDKERVDWIEKGAVSLNFAFATNTWISDHFPQKNFRSFRGLIDAEIRRQRKGGI